jgi:hypothetical protein
MTRRRYPHGPGSGVKASKSRSGVAVRHRAYGDGQAGVTAVAPVAAALSGLSRAS